MKFIDILLLIAIAAALALALRRAWRNRGRTCDGNCAGCGLCDEGRARKP